MNRAATASVTAKSLALPAHSIAQELHVSGNFHPGMASAHLDDLHIAQSELAADQVRKFIEASQRGLQDAAFIAGDAAVVRVDRSLAEGISKSAKESARVDIARAGGDFGTLLAAFDRIGGVSDAYGFEHDTSPIEPREAKAEATREEKDKSPDRRRRARFDDISATSPSETSTAAEGMGSPSIARDGERSTAALRRFDAKLSLHEQIQERPSKVAQHEMNQDQDAAAGYDAAKRGKLLRIPGLQLGQIQNS